MRSPRGQILKLKYHPFPFGEKSKKEYTIGEALLRWKGIGEHEVATLRNFVPPAPDLVFKSDDHGEIRVEVTELVPYDRGAEVRRRRFLSELRTCLRALGTRPPKPSNVLVSREPFDSPPLRPGDVDSIAGRIDAFFKAGDFETRYDITQRIVASPVTITFIPALKNASANYDGNLFIEDITGLPLASEHLEQTFEEVVRRKRDSAMTADVLAVFQGTAGIVAGLDEARLGKGLGRLTSGLAYGGIYVVEIIQYPLDYWVHVITVREHPLFAGSPA